MTVATLFELDGKPMMDKKDADKAKALESALAQIERQFGKGSIMKLGQNNAVMDVEAISTGSLGLDIALGIGGLPKGRIIEIYGPESSGKTTLTKLIQGLYPYQEGLIRFDGIDAREIELAHLRRQIGVVLQENFLFRGSIRENLAMTKPDASFEEIVEAAQASGADEFIERMPQGYDTLLEENAANLSGGQKQRLSIARSLLSKPRILILDEAASALDPESEAIFIKNLSRIAVGKTVIMISHRLSTLVNAHSILVMQQGKLVDSGTHKQLLEKSETYSHLWNQQTSHI